MASKSRMMLYKVTELSIFFNINLSFIKIRKHLFSRVTGKENIYEY